MKEEIRVRNLMPPVGCVDAILDTDAYNEIDDQFAVALFLREPERIRPLALTAAPFHNARSSGAADGMEKSYEELLRLTALLGRTDVPVLRGSDRYLPSEREPVVSEAAERIVACAREHSPEKPLYVLAIGAITNVASALLLDPAIAENIVVVWLGGNSRSWEHTREFNMIQDVPAARVVMHSGAPLVQLPCMGVVSALTVTMNDVKTHLIGKGKLADYLGQATLDYCADRIGTPRSKVIWDITAVAWLLNDGDRYMRGSLLPTFAPTADGYYELTPRAPLCRVIEYVNRDALIEYAFGKVTE